MPATTELQRHLSVYAQTAFDDAHALALREAVLGDTHPDFSPDYDSLDRAEPLFQRALAE